ncbi:MAG: response regulator [Caldilineae bacterium]|nr:MAG: response regulator [Caldilineae bacterium]
MPSTANNTRQPVPAPKVLIVDDEPNIVISLEFLMRQAGYQVEVARNGEEAVERILQDTPDVVLLDVMLPGMDGFEVCQWIREHPEWNYVKIIMLTAKGRDVEIAKGFALGADAYITKPFSTRHLVQEVQRVLNEAVA